MSQRELLSIIVCLRGQRQSVLQELSALRLSLLQNDTEEGIRAFRELCSVLLAMEQLVEVAKLAAGDEHARELAVAEDLRTRTLEESVPLLTAARHDLPGAAEALRSFIEDPDR
ncbi:MAG TPA: hypothetical protein VNO30_17100 [Kofleriaceae bacterium]|nr:hypothetical protein [Kofleriaceae bacterium]